MKINWKWPKTETNDLRTWYHIIWTIPWFCLYKVAGVVLWFSVLMVEGLDFANDVYEDLP